MAAALIPRVRTLLICDGIRPSRAEENVFHLRGARSHIVARAFPIYRRMRLFAILSSPQPGRFPSYVKVIDDETNQAVYYGQVDPSPLFPDTADLLPLDLPVTVRFSKPGRYTSNCGSFKKHPRIF